MTAENFTYWLQGFMEVQNPETLDKTQVQIIKDHLALVFNKLTPNRRADEIAEEIKKYEEQVEKEEAGWFDDDILMHGQPGVILDCHQDTFCKA